MWRDVFRYVINPEVFLDAENLRGLVAQAVGEDPVGAEDSTLDGIILNLVRVGEEQAASWSGLIASTRSADMRRDIAQTILVQSAPFACAIGVWLQGLSAPGVFEDETHLKILALLADDVGVGQPEASRADAFRLIARRAGLTAYAGQVRDLVSTRTIRDPMFRLPALLFALSRRSDSFGPELAGIDYALRCVGLPPAWRALAAGRVDEPGWARLDLSAALTGVIPAPHTPLSLSRWIADRFGTDPVEAARVRHGAAWVARGLADWSRDLEDLARAAVDPRLAMALLVQERAREAGAYHQDYELEGRSLAAWFKQARDEPLSLVDALARSKLVRPSDPDRSALIGILIRPNGPMFRIIREEDVALIRRWIASLDPNAPAPEILEPRPEHLPIDALSPRAGTIREGDASLGPVPGSIREAYYLLQGRALPPRTRAFALDYARFWIEAAGRSIDSRERSLPGEWMPGRIRAWLLDAHDRHADAFEQDRNHDMPSRDEVIDQTLQLAPLTLIDGAWLQGFTETSLAATRIGFPLFETYWDELGNGDRAINHPKIYRDVLAAMAITLPPTGSLAFAQDPRLQEASFRLPVYWLCLGKFPVTLRPEILGMNLAMELSGVGGSYRSARRFLKHHGFPTLFVDIHNTIDNVSTGHSAWAADAIDAYMLSVSEFGNVDAEWERVRAGYESLAPIVKRPADLDYFRRAPAPIRRTAVLDGAFHHPPIGTRQPEAHHA